MKAGQSGAKQYYVAALDVGATECRMAVQLVDGNCKATGPAFVCVLKQEEIGRGYVTNNEVASRAVAKAAGILSSELGFDVKEMAVLLTVGEAHAESHTHSARCTESNPGTSSKIVTPATLESIQDQAHMWRLSEEGNREWVVVYNESVDYYMKDRGVRMRLASPEGTFTDSIESDYLGIKVQREYYERFKAVIDRSQIHVTKQYLEGLTWAGQKKKNEAFQDRYLFLYLGHTKSVLSEAFERENGDLQLSHYAWLPGIGTEFCVQLANAERGWTQESAYSALRNDARFDLLNFDAETAKTLLVREKFESDHTYNITCYGVTVATQLAANMVKTLQSWYDKETQPKIRMHIKLSGGIAGMKGLGQLLKKCFEIVEEYRVVTVEMLEFPMNYAFVAGGELNEQQVKEETLHGVFGVLRQEMMRKEPVLVGGSPERDSDLEPEESLETTSEADEGLETETKRRGGLLEKLREKFQRAKNGPII